MPTTPPNDAQHEADAQAFIKELDDTIARIVKGDGLSPFVERNKLVQKLRDLIADSYWRGLVAGEARIRALVNASAR